MGIGAILLIKQLTGLKSSCSSDSYEYWFTKWLFFKQAKRISVSEYGFLENLPQWGIWILGTE